jgi:predicted LPLAT superfamily acyltransferase
MSEGRNQEQAWTSRGERGAAATIKLIVWIALHVGRTGTRLLLYPICLYFLIFSRASRAASYRYLRHVFGREPTLADCFRHCHSFAACVLDRVYLLNNQIDQFDVTVTGEDIAKAEVARGTGWFLFGAHLGSFEILRSLGHRQPGLKLSLLMYEDNARKINAALNAINPELVLEIIALGQAGSMLTVEQRLDQGHAVAILADRSLSLADDEQMTVEFLGAPARFPLGPFRLAALLRRPVILMVGLYQEGGRYEVYFEQIADFRGLAKTAATEAIETALRRYVARLEHFCRLAPYNWFNFYDFWQ